MKEFVQIYNAHKEERRLEKLILTGEIKMKLDCEKYA